MEGARISLCLLLAALCFGCRSSEPDYQEPPQDLRFDQKGEWVFKRRFEAIQKQGNEETLRFVQQELAGRVFPWSSGDETLLNFLKDNGGHECLPLLKEWLDCSGRIVPGRNLDWAETRWIAGHAWYEISKRQCKTRDQRLSMITGALLNDPIGYSLSPDYVVADLRELLPESRAEIYKMLLNMDLCYFQVPANGAIRDFVSDPAFELKPEEVQNIWKQGGSLGKRIVFSLNLVKSSEVEPFWEGCKSSPDPVERIEGFLHFAEKGPDGVEAMIAHLREARLAPLNERNELELYNGTLYLGGPGIPVSEKKAIGDYANWVLKMSPPLRLYDVREFEHMPGRRSGTTEADGILAWRKSLREAAESLQKSCAEKRQ